MNRIRHNDKALTGCAVLAGWLGAATSVPASVLPDPGPAEFLRSDRYAVSLSTGPGEPSDHSFVYVSRNAADFDLYPAKTFMAEANHWTSYSTDEPVWVEVTALGRSSVTSCVVWQQFNGGVFQFSWDRMRVDRGLSVRDIDIIHDEHHSDANNRGLFSCVKLHQSVMRGLIFEDIRIEGDTFRLLDLRAQEGGRIEGGSEINPCRF